MTRIARLTGEDLEYLTGYGARTATPEDARRDGAVCGDAAHARRRRSPRTMRTNTTVTARLSREDLEYPIGDGTRGYRLIDP